MWNRRFEKKRRKHCRKRRPILPPRVEQLESRIVPSTLVWSDEFNGAAGTAPNSANWSYVTGGGGYGNNEWEIYSNSLANAQIVNDPNATDGKALQISAIHTSQAIGYGDYTSARLVSQGLQSFQYGEIDIRAEMPYELNGEGQGLWPAVWMMGNSGGWPACGEMDIMENIGSQPGTNHGTIHGPVSGGGDYNGGNGVTAQYTLPNGQDFNSGYHIFTDLWSPNSIQFLVDGNVYSTLTPASMPSGEPGF